jgi:hypothetical protein
MHSFHTSIISAKHIVPQPVKSKSRKSKENADHSQLFFALPSHSAKHMRQLHIANWSRNRERRRTGIFLEKEKEKKKEKIKK